MNLYDLFQEALAALTADKARSFLTILGIIAFGVSAAIGLIFGYYPARRAV